MRSAPLRSTTPFSQPSRHTHNNHNAVSRELTEEAAARRLAADAARLRSAAASPSSTAPKPEAAAAAAADLEALRARRVRFVTREWFTDAIAAGARRPEADYDARPRKAPPSEAAAAAKSPSSKAAAAASPGSGGKRRRSASPDGGGADGEPRSPRRQRTFAGGDFDPAGSPPAPPIPAGVRAPPPEEVCLPGQAWGEGGRWIEAYDEAKALAARARLMNYWRNWAQW